jgi:hypothetical protein
MFDAMTTGFDEVRIWRDPACPACGADSPFVQTSDERVEVPA